MLVFSTIPFVLEPDDVIFNLCSYIMGYERIDILPMINTNYYESVSIDIEYANKILTEDYSFMEFMSKIMIPLYYYKNVIILINDDPLFLAITDIIIKFIQERYDYTANIVQSQEDISTLVEGQFLAHGILNLDADKERYFHMIGKK